MHRTDIPPRFKRFIIHSVANTECVRLLNYHYVAVILQQRNLRLLNQSTHTSCVNHMVSRCLKKRCHAVTLEAMSE